MLMGVPFLLFVIYLGFAVGTKKKFKLNGITLGGLSKLLFLIIPLVFFLLHSFWAMKALFNKDFSFSKKLFKLTTIDYPVLIGILIETVLEFGAIKVSEKHMVQNVKKQTKRERVIRKKFDALIDSLSMRKGLTIIKAHINNVNKFRPV